MYNSLNLQTRLKFSFKLRLLVYYRYRQYATFFRWIQYFNDLNMHTYNYLFI